MGERDTAVDSSGQPRQYTGRGLQGRGGRLVGAYLGMSGSPAKVRDRDSGQDTGGWGAADVLVQPEGHSEHAALGERSDTRARQRWAEPRPQASDRRQVQRSGHSTRMGVRSRVAWGVRAGLKNGWGQSTQEWNRDVPKVSLSPRGPEQEESLFFWETVGRPLYGRWGNWIPGSRLSWGCCDPLTLVGQLTATSANGCGHVWKRRRDCVMVGFLTGLTLGKVRGFLTTWTKITRGRNWVGIIVLHCPTQR